MTSDVDHEFARLLGSAALRLWPNLPRDVQEELFELAVPQDAISRLSLAIYLHDHHQRTAHLPKPTALARNHATQIINPVEHFSDHVKR